VTSTLTGPASTAASDAAPEAPPGGHALTGLDLLAGGALLLVALIAWASLALAHLGLHSAPAALGAALLVLAALVAGALLWARRAGVRLVADLPGVGAALACAAVAAALAFPGFSYGVADKDPGGYVSHAIAISHTGSYAFVDPLLETAAQDPTFPVQLTSPGARFAGVWVRDASTG
jgi:hypothetical protein